MASYKELEVYKKAYALALQVYKETEVLPKEEQYGLQSQLRRAAVSIPLNIAEGYGKNSSAKEIGRYLSMARGSCSEAEVLLQFMEDLGYIPTEAVGVLMNGYDEVGKMLRGLAKSVTNN